MRHAIWALLLLAIGCHTSNSQDEGKWQLNPPADSHDARPSDKDDPQAWSAISQVLKLQGAFANDCFTITVSRDDLWVNSDIGDIPTAAGLATTLHFFKCPCGRTSVVGRFVVADYEANDVIAELQTDAKLSIAGMTPMFMGEKPRIMAIYFQGDGDPEVIAGILKQALARTGEKRMAPLKVPADGR